VSRIESAHRDARVSTVAKFARALNVTQGNFLAASHKPCTPRRVKAALTGRPWQGKAGLCEVLYIPQEFSHDDIRMVPGLLLRVAANNRNTVGVVEAILLRVVGLTTLMASAVALVDVLSDGVIEELVDPSVAPVASQRDVHVMPRVCGRRNFPNDLRVHLVDPDFGGLGTVRIRDIAGDRARQPFD
jgi:hypothetical protein